MRAQRAPSAALAAAALLAALLPLPSGAQGPTFCPSSPPLPLFGRCLVATSALPTPLCNLAADGQSVNLTDCLHTCGPGWNCPNVSDCWPQDHDPDGPHANALDKLYLRRPAFCPPTVTCATKRLGSEFCDEAQGLFEPLLCPPGFYCPDAVSVLACPAGTWCMRGSVAPVPCDTFSYCPPQTEFRRYYGGLLACLLLDLALAALYFATRRYIEPALRDGWSRARKAGRKPIYGLLPGLAAVAGGAFGLGSGGSGGSGGGGAAPAFAAAPEDYVELLQAGQGAPGPSASPGSKRLLPRLPPAVAGGPSAEAMLLRRNFKLANGENFKFDIGFSRFGFEVEALKPVGADKSAGPVMQRQTILKDVTGSIQTGKMTAIMGPSGAGKTSFLKCLFGKEQAVATSELRINGRVDEMSTYKKMIGFVPQEDVVIEELTVRENILFSARTRLPQSWHDEDIQDHVDAVMSVLGLTNNANTLFANCSGGQKKRTNIAVELATAPAALFLDEPTSGLDSTVALQICRELKQIARMGTTIVTVIHQPRVDIFNEFDDLILFANHPERDLHLWDCGNLAYLGPQRFVEEYFRGVGWEFVGNPADDVMEALMGFSSVAGDATEVVRGRERVLLGKIQAKEGGYRATAGGGGAGGGAGALPSAADSTSVSLLSASGEEADLSMASEDDEGSGGGGGGGGARSPAARKRLYGELLSKYWAVEGRRWVDDKARSHPAPASPRASEGDSGSSSSLNAAEAGAGEQASTSQAAVAAATAARGAPFLSQVALCHWRSLVQQYRTHTSFSLEVAVGVLAGGMMGAAALAVPSLYVGVLRAPYVFISPSPIESLLPSIALFIALAISVAASPAGVKTFGEERHVYFREASSGHNRLAYYLAKSLAVTFRLTVGAFHFVAVFHCLATPTMDFVTMFGIVWCQYFCVYGLAAMMSMLVARENSALVGVIASLIASCLCGYGPSLVQGRAWGVYFVQAASFARWASEAFFHAETLAYRNHFMVEEVSAGIWGYTLDRFTHDIGMMILLGLVMRAAAFGLMVLLNRKEQK